MSIVSTNEDSSTFFGIIKPYMNWILPVLFVFSYCVFRFLIGQKKEKTKKDFPLSQGVSNKSNLSSDEHQKYLDIIKENDNKNYDAFKILGKLSESGALPDKAIYINLIEMSFKFDQVLQVRKVYEEISDLSNSLLNRVDIFNTILNGLSSKFETDQKLITKELSFYLEEMKKRKINFSTETYNIIIDAFLKLNQFSIAMKYFREMRSAYQAKPDQVTYSLLFAAICRSQEEDQAFLCFSEIYFLFKTDFIESNLQIYSQLIEILNRKNNFIEEILLYEKMPSHIKEKCEIAVHNCLLNAFYELKHYDRVFVLFTSLKKQSEEIPHFAMPNINTYLILIKTAIRGKKFDDAKFLYKHVKENYSAILSIDFFNKVSESFAMINEFEMAIAVLSEAKSYMLEKDIISYSILMKIYFIQFNEEKTILTFDEMLRNNVSPNMQIYLTLLQLFIRERKIIQAIGIFTDMKLNSCNPNAEIYSMIINACIANNKVDKAVELIIEADSKKILFSPQVYKMGFESLMKNGKTIKQQEKAFYGKTLVDIMKKYGCLEDKDESEASL